MSDPLQAAGFPIENAYFYGIIFSSLIFGIELTMCFLSTYIHVTKRSKDHAYIGLGLGMVLIRAIGYITNVLLLNYMWINHRFDFPGGPLAYADANTSVWWQDFGNVAGQLNFFIADGILIYRCYIIWNSEWFIIVVPILTYLVSVAFAIALTVFTSAPGSRFFQGQQVNFGIVWATFSVSTQVLVTGLIAYRILRARRQFIDVFGRDDESIQTYTGVVAILIETALPYTIVSIVWVISWSRGLPATPALSMIWGMVASLTPQFIIFRVATGHAWALKTMDTMISTLRFEPSEVAASGMGSSRKTAAGTSGLIRKTVTSSQADSVELSVLDV